MIIGYCTWTLSECCGYLIADDLVQGEGVLAGF